MGMSGGEFIRRALQICITDQVRKVSVAFALIGVVKQKKKKKTGGINLEIKKFRLSNTSEESDTFSHR